MNLPSTPRMTWLLAGLVGFLLNMPHERLIEDLHLDFGLIPVLMAAMTRGGYAGLGAALIAMTFFHLDQPVTLLVQTLSAFVLGDLVVRRHRHELPAFITFWVCIGGPILALDLALDYQGFAPIPVMEALHEVTVSLAALVTAKLLISIGGFGLVLGGDAGSRESLRRRMVSQFTLLAAIPLLLVGLLDLHAAYREDRERESARLGLVSRLVSAQISDYLDLSLIHI